ncbi:ABC transporter ATP-binding protein [Roseateles koreensis]|uniref:ABC transporter ATP-binding protein n=1 Tax=Roseateles koreensis TaxID=2987526 RepID=A0ABT5KTZ9_9BURK|nr:ABC transporter ATP-binding protein [Roseateles koreensis]MDC8785242.1 ABC transporter ATP-binding protein [Roseateles koreensis]
MYKPHKDSMPMPASSPAASLRACASAPESEPATAPAIAVRQVLKTFAGKHEVKALEAVDLTVAPHEFVSILGPSGCGKSTLLRIVAGLTPYQGGEVQVNQRPVKGPSPEIGVVFQSSNMLPWLTVADNMALGAKLRGLDMQVLHPKLEQLTETLGLKGFEKHHPHQLSGGMRQRAAIGQILALDPQILLMDEPFGALDALTRDRLNVELLRIWQTLRQTVLLVTHSIAEAVFLSDRVIVMSGRPGRVVQEIQIDLPRPRQPEEIKSDPRYGEYIAELSALMGVFNDRH